MNLKKTIVGSTALLGVFAASFAASNALWIDHEKDDYNLALSSYKETVIWDGNEISQDSSGYSQFDLWDESSIRKLEKNGELNRMIEVDMESIGAIRAVDNIYSPVIYFKGDILNETTQKFFNVSDPSQCNTDSDEYNEATAYTKEDDDGWGYGIVTNYFHTIETLGYDSDKVYICYSAKFPKTSGEEGVHTNTATVQGKSDNEAVEDKDSWSASVKKKETNFTEEQIEDQIRITENFSPVEFTGGYGSNSIYNGPDDSITKTPSETYNPVSPTIQP